MLMQVLSLTPDQINALPPDERNAIQQLVSKMLSRFPRLFTDSAMTAQSIHWRHYSLVRRQNVFYLDMVVFEQEK
jgi:hypothetical protein